MGGGAGGVPANNVQSGDAVTSDLDAERVCAYQQLLEAQARLAGAVAQCPPDCLAEAIDELNAVAYKIEHMTAYDEDD